MFKDWWNEDERLYDLIDRLLAQHVIERGNGGKLRLVVTAVNLNSPWFFIRHGSNRDCALWHDLYFKNLDLIHSACFNCWKTVITVQHEGSVTKGRVVDLFKLRDQLTGMQLPSKCGIDVRYYTKARYAGFVYGDSLDQGLAYYKMVSQRLDPEIYQVILKRGCTEFEIRYPDSTQWGIGPDQLEFEDKLQSIFDETPTPDHGAQEELTNSKVFRLWIDYAHQIGDETWRDALIYEGYDDPGEYMYPPPMTYHDLTEEELKNIFKLGTS